MDTVNESAHRVTPLDPSRLAAASRRRLWCAGASATCWRADADGRARVDVASLRASAPWRRPATARSVIFLFMEGGPSHLDTFDPKPELNRLAGQPLPPSFKPVITPMGEGALAAPGLAAEVEAARPERDLGLRLAAAHRHLRRRHRGDPLVLVQRAEPRRRRLPDEHRLDAGRPALAGELGDLRPGHREREPARRSS